MARDYRAEANVARAVRPHSTGIQEALGLGIMLRRQRAAEAQTAAQEEMRQREEDARISQAVYGGGSSPLSPQRATSGKRGGAAPAIATPSGFKLEEVASEYQAPLFLEGTALEGTVAPVADVRRYLSNPRIESGMPEMTPRELEEGLAEYSNWRGDALADLQARDREASIGDIQTALGMSKAGRAAEPDALRAMAESEYTTGLVSPELQRQSTVSAAVARDVSGRMRERLKKDQWKSAYVGYADELQAADPKLSRSEALRRAKMEMSPAFVNQFKANTDRLTQQGKALTNKGTAASYKKSIATARQFISSDPLSKGWTDLKKDQTAVFLASNPSYLNQYVQKKLALSDTDAMVAEHLGSGAITRGEGYGKDNTADERNYAVERGLVWDAGRGAWVATQELAYPGNTIAVGSSVKPKTLKQIYAAFPDKL